MNKKVEKLSLKDRAFLARVVIEGGRSDHQLPTAENVHTFADRYVLKCIDKAIELLERIKKEVM